MCISLRYMYCLQLSSSYKCNSYVKEDRQIIMQMSSIIFITQPMVYWTLVTKVHILFGAEMVECVFYIFLKFSSTKCNRPVQWLPHVDLRGTYIWLILIELPVCDIYYTVHDACCVYTTTFRERYWGHLEILASSLNTQRWLHYRDYKWVYHKI